MISGSFILQCIYDTQWPNSDIDIYCSGKFNCDIFPENLYRSHISASRNNYSELFDILEVNNVYDLYPRSRRNNEALLCQLIALNIPRKEIYDWIRDNFDFNVCVNCFYLQNSEPHFEALDIGAILTKTISITGKLNLRTYNKRIEKYEQRGFKFIN